MSSISDHSMAGSKKIVPSKYYSDIQMIGKHYLIWAKDKVKRHYTISNCMEPKVYDEYMKVMRDYNRGVSELKFNKKFLECDSEKQFCVTIKKYNSPNGFSKFVHEQKDATYEV